MFASTVEWYDFFRYLTAAALIFPKLSFPGGDEFVGIIAAFGTHMPRPYEEPDKSVEAAVQQG